MTVVKDLEKVDKMWLDRWLLYMT